MPDGFSNADISERGHWRRRTWTRREVDPGAFADARLGRRFEELLRQLGDGVGASIPLACQDWANTKAAYRFLSNARVDEADILSGHFAATRDRFTASAGTILLLQDTTDFVFQRASPHAIGITKSINSGRDKRGRLRHHTLCGILMHTSLVVTVDGLPLGLSAAKMRTRAKFKGTAALKKKINPTRVPIEKKESVRWLDNLRQSIENSAIRRAAFISATEKGTLLPVPGVGYALPRPYLC